MSGKLVSERGEAGLGSGRISGEDRATGPRSRFVRAGSGWLVASAALLGATLLAAGFTHAPSGGVAANVAPGGREITRRVGPKAITTALAAARTVRVGTPAARPAPAVCPVSRVPRLRWVEETDPRARRVYRRFAGGRWGVPEIFKAMSLRQDLMEKALDLSEIGHFSDGYLDRRTKERIATFVSALNGSHYCTGSHASGLQAMGAGSVEIAALARGDLDAASLSPKERALFQFLRRLTLKPDAITDQDVARLRAQGWRDEQIFEAAFDAALFAFFNRVANTYGLDYPPDGWKPPAQPLRAALPSSR